MAVCSFSSESLGVISVVHIPPSSAISQLFHRAEREDGRKVSRYRNASPKRVKSRRRRMSSEPVSRGPGHGCAAAGGQGGEGLRTLGEG